jgi:glutathione S-transferase
MKKNPAVNLPYLIDGDKIISESNAVLVYIIHKAQRVELLGRNWNEKVIIATADGVVNDLYQDYISLVYEINVNSFEEAAEEYLEKFKGSLRKLSGIIGEKDYFAGGITWLDFVVSDFVQTLQLFEPKLF